MIKEERKMDYVVKIDVGRLIFSISKENDETAIKTIAKEVLAKQEEKKND